MKTSESDYKKATGLIRRLTPSKASYNRYEAATKAFIAEHAHMICDIPAATKEIYGFKMVPSKLFKRKYLVAFVADGWFSEMAPGCNAIATDCLAFLYLSSPPLVVVSGKTMPKSSGFSSIVEHEFVHVNQAIQGRMPNLQACELNAKVLFKELVNFTLAEYEANLIQLTHD